MQLRLTDLDIRWTGTDGTTPAGHVIAVGFDPLGNTRIFLWAGNTPDDATFRGSILLRDGRTVGAYGPHGAWVTSRGDHTALLACLAAA
jgi:hypothetical protein